ncbi:MAG: LysR family transcriptional regulator [Rhizobiaceae bacterium]
MNIRSVDLNLLVAFDALFDERSVSRAADRLALTQPTVSGMLKRLRQIFADELFVRTSYGILPTPRAEALATPVKELLDKAQAIIKPEEFDPTTDTSTIRICGSDYLQMSVISPLISRLRVVAPSMRVSVVPRPATGLSDILARGEIDVSVSITEVAVPDLPSRKLFSDRYICVARNSHPLNNHITLKELCAYDHALVDPTRGLFAGPMDEVLSAKGLQRRVAVSVPTFSMLFNALDGDDYLAFIPSRLFRGLSSRLKTLQVDIDSRRLDVIANWHSRMNGDARHKWLRDQLVEATRQN